MSSITARTWAVRLAAALAAVLIPACGDSGSPGGQNPNGIFWNSLATPGGGDDGGTGDPGGTLWVDPNSGLGASPIGIGNIISSADDATYDGYHPGGQGGLGTAKITYIAGRLHPLSTDTGTTSITTRENQLQAQINAYRQQRLGNVGAGGGVNGGIVGGNVTGILLSGHFKATKSARAHCKHYALHHPGFPAGANAEGDALQTTAGQGNPFGTPAPGNPDGDKGRLGKIGVTALPPVPAGNSIVLSGAQYGDPGAVFTQLVVTQPAVLIARTWTNVVVGHWRGGPNAFYWHIVFLTSPTPAI